MSCCRGNCGCVADCKCGSGCSGCNMYPDLGGERVSTTSRIIDLGGATPIGHIEGLEIAAGSEGGSCNCNKCKCGTSCSCACCDCN